MSSLIENREIARREKTFETVSKAGATKLERERVWMGKSLG